MNFIHLVRNTWRSISICVIYGLCVTEPSTLFAQTIRVDTSHPVKPIIPAEVLKEVRRCLEEGAPFDRPAVRYERQPASGA